MRVQKGQVTTAALVAILCHSEVKAGGKPVFVTTDVMNTSWETFADVCEWGVSNQSINLSMENTWLGSLLVSSKPKF